ncbi:DUF7547 family protein [Halorubrum halodurans]|uniref:Uncharacterized protein n=1 Tax=Halorubrum halodurans TaxID=1383851 RepID=A0A256IBV1_9EURY|nr:hypothetical protein [Halorubrum halodurans]OYR53786.1 hypothetical protein DJ70_15645 [Halorubrum halodurans]
MSSRGSRDGPRDDDLEERLDELEDVLSDLRRDLRETERDRRGPPRPPRLSELVRFTEQYTIPTLIALLETTITSLELVRGTLRLLDPGRELREDADATAGRLADARDGAATGLARSLSELRTALAEADLPEEAASRSIIEDARDLSAEIEARIEEGRREADAARRSERGTADRSESDDRTGSGDRDGAVRIDVTDPDEARGDGSTAGDPEDDGSAAESRPAVDVESELESIKSQLDDGTENERNDAAADAGDDTGSDAPAEGDEER